MKPGRAFPANDHGRRGAMDDDVPWMKNKAEAAHRRGDLLLKRSALMERGHVLLPQNRGCVNRKMTF